MKEWIVADSQIKQRFEDHVFSTKLNVTERRTSEAFQNVCRNFLRNKKAENYSKIVQDLMSSTVLWGKTAHWNFIFCITIWSSNPTPPPPKKWAASPMNMAKGSTRTFPKRKRGTVENWVQICCLITAKFL
jgi:hypothetical protein